MEWASGKVGTPGVDEVPRRRSGSIRLAVSMKRAVPTWLIPFSCGFESGVPETQPQKLRHWKDSDC